MCKKQIRKLLADTLEKSFALKRIDFEVTEEERFGDYSTNVALILARLLTSERSDGGQAKQVGENPKEIALKIIDSIKTSDIIESAEVAGPGFINFKISIPYLNTKISEIIKAGEKYGSSDLSKDLKVNIEFISANPTGPLTVGNSRGGVIGDVLSNVLSKVGYDVTREYYFNDAGGQIDVLGHSILKDEMAEYKGAYIDKLHGELGEGDYREIGKRAAQIIISEIKKTTKKMGINFDVWFAEGKDLRDKGKVDEIISWLKGKDLVYEKDGAWWFRSTSFGDDKDRVVLRSNGEPTYFALDCAYHQNKFVERKFDRVINIWGADHHGDLARLKGFVKALGFEDKFAIIIHQFVRVIKDGQEVRMSKRAGNYITVDELLDEVGKDVYRFFMLAYSPDSHLTFDLGLAKEQSEKNPVYYVQYAYARINSILEKSEIRNQKPASPAGGSETNPNDQMIKGLKKPEEIKLIKQLIQLPELVEEIVGDYQVQKLPLYAIELARVFHHFYEKCPVIQAENPEVSAARIQLLKATQIVLKNTLDLIGVSAPEKM